MNECALEPTALLEAALLAAAHPLDEAHLQMLLGGALGRPVSAAELGRWIEALEGLYENRGLGLKRVAGGLRLEIRSAFVQALSALWEPKPPRYSRALLETLAIIAYRQPVTRGEIEELRGISVAGSTLRILEERNWIQVVGHREVPGRPALYATTREFLDYFGLSSLSDLPPLEKLADLIEPTPEFDLATPPDQLAEAPLLGLPDPEGELDAGTEKPSRD